MWMLSKCGQKGCTGFATRPCSSVSASSRWLNSSVTTGTGAGITGSRARRNVTNPTASSIAARAGLGIWGTAILRGRQPFCHAHASPAMSAISKRL
jgi:hypothetical protein